MDDLKTLLLSLQPLAHVTTIVTTKLDVLLLVNLPRIAALDGDLGSQLRDPLDVLVL